jgi:hypothetical protein
MAMAQNNDPNQRDRDRRTQNPPPTDPNPHRERPMDDPGRGQGDKFERKLPGNEKDQPSRSK